jgi:hypothetical protein
LKKTAKITMLVALVLVALSISGCGPSEAYKADKDAQYVALPLCTSQNVVNGHFMGPGTSCREALSEGEARKAEVDEIDRVTKQTEQRTSNAAKAHAELEKLIEKHNADEASENDREVQREKQAEQKARRVAAKAATEQAKSDQAMDAYKGLDCLQTMSRYENDIRDSLRWLQTSEFEAQRCSVQHKILKFLSAYPPAERAEQFDRLLDAAAGH